MVQLTADNPNLKFVIPEAGGMIWTDNMLIPTGGDVFTASTFMNFVYDPKIAAQIEAYVNYICPVEGAKEEIKAIDAELADNQLIFPTTETLAKVKIFDAEAADNEELQGAVPGASSAPEATVGCLHRHRGIVPYLLLAPGLAFLALFFVVPIYYLGNTSLQTGSLDVGYAFTWAW